MKKRESREPSESEIEETLGYAMITLAPDAPRSTGDDIYEDLAGVLELTARELAAKGDDVNAAVANSLADRAWIFAHERYIGETAQEYRGKYIEAWCAKHDPDTPVH